MDYDFQLESKLLNDDPELQRIFADNVLVCQNMLLKYKAVFPLYTDHTVLHSLEVIAFCNNLVGDQIDKLNSDEIFVLLMGAYLHDSGMGIDSANYESLSKLLPMVEKFRAENPDAPVPTVIRTFHHEFSGKYIEKYAGVFEIPTEEHLFSIIQVSRGHRKTNLYDEKEYPNVLLSNGNVIRTAYLSALIRLADELDIAIDRNLQFNYDLSSFTTRHDIFEFKKHEAVKNVEFADDRFVVTVDYSEEELRPELDELFIKLKQTLDYCVDVVEKRTDFEIRQRNIELIKL